MRIYVAPQPGLSRAMDRVANALIENRGKHTIVEHKETADLVVLHVIGYPETVEAIEQCKKNHQFYAMIQYCVRTTQEKHTAKWLPLWAGAEVVWSYYDLRALAAEDGVSFTANFYYAPLGVNAELFRPWDVRKEYAVCTSGYVAHTECIGEVANATAALGLKQFHLGPDNLELGDHVRCKMGMTDYTLAQFYSACDYVTGLRRIEGFELPAAEGLLCGVRPILFDAPHYRKWFGDSAIYIHEGSPEEVTESLTAVLAQAPAPVTASERARAAYTFDWPAIVEGLWARLEPAAVPVTVSPVDTRRKVLWVGDAGVSSGFAKCTHETLDVVRQHYDVMVLGLNYMGDPHNYPYKIFPCHSINYPGDFFGVHRLPDLVNGWKPDAIVLQNDPWNIPAYFESMKEKCEKIPPVIGALAVDGKNCRGRDLNDLTVAVFWTKFAETEAKLGGFKRQSFVIGLGVDLKVFKPMHRLEARKLLKLPEHLHSAFIVGNVNRNQPRKRLDLTIAYFCEWVKEYKADAHLYLHVAPTGDQGYDVIQLMEGYYHLGKRLILAQPEIGQGAPIAEVAATYNAFDVQITTTQGEGWGLTTMEGMACGVPQIVPYWSALGEWTGDAVYKVPCPTQIATPNYINAIGGVPDKQATIEALDLLYRNDKTRNIYAQLGWKWVQRPEFRWPQVGAEFSDVLRALFDAVERQKEPEAVAV